MWSVLKNTLYFSILLPRGLTIQKNIYFF